MNEYDWSAYVGGDLIAIGTIIRTVRLMSPDKLRMVGSMEERYDVFALRKAVGGSEMLREEFFGDQTPPSDDDAPPIGPEPFMILDGPHEVTLREGSPVLEKLEGDRCSATPVDSPFKPVMILRLRQLGYDRCAIELLLRGRYNEGDIGRLSPEQAANLYAELSLGRIPRNEIGVRQAA